MFKMIICPQLIPKKLQQSLKFIFHVSYFVESQQTSVYNLKSFKAKIHIQE